MKTPRFTDNARQPDGGYVHSDYSDIRRTLERARYQLRQTSEDPLDPHTWIEHPNPSPNTRSTKD